jgi:hypothetical protein
MNQIPKGSELSATRAASEHDLEALPAPRHPWRKLTFATMTIAALGSLVLAFTLRGEAIYALRTQSPVTLNVAKVSEQKLSNQWVHAEATLRADAAVHFRRPLESDSYRVARTLENDRLYVQIRVPDDPHDPTGQHFVPPVSFAGRLIPMNSAGLRHSAVRHAIEEAGVGPVPPDAWLLIEGESPGSVRWALALEILFIAFAAFNIFGLARLARRVQE